MRWHASYLPAQVRCSQLHRRDGSRKAANPRMNTSDSTFGLAVFLLTNPGPDVWPTPAFSELSPTPLAPVGAHPVALRYECVCHDCMERSSCLTPADLSQWKRRTRPPSPPESRTSGYYHFRVATSSGASRWYQNRRVEEWQYDFSADAARGARWRKRNRMQDNVA